MTTSDEMHAFFESKQFEQLQRYLEQGRGFAKLSDDDLNQRWISELRYWVANFGSRVDHRLQEDIEAELQIRGLEPPFALVPEEFEALMAASRQQTDRILSDPRRLARTERNMSEDMEEFRKGSAGKRTN